MLRSEAWPQCDAQRFKKHGPIHNGQQHPLCKDCGRQGVLPPENRVIAQDQRSLGERLLREQISWQGICRAVGVSMWWLMACTVACCEAAPEHVHVQPARRPGAVLLRRVEGAADERHRLVKKTAHEPWRCWPSPEERGTASRCTSATAAARGRDTCGRTCPPRLERQPRSRRISRWATQVSAPQIATKRARRKPGSPIPVSASTIRYASGCPDWCARHWPLPSRWRIPSGRSGIASAIIT